MSNRFFGPLLASLIFCSGSSFCLAQDVTVGSKAFTESVILGEIITHLARHQGLTVHHHRQLGGTRILWEALLAGEIDIYPEYTGTITNEIFADLGMVAEEDIHGVLATRGLGMSGPIGFNNTYAVGILQETSEGLGINNISDLRKYPNLTFGFGNEFLERNDGWVGLRKHYSLPQTQVIGLDHDLAYQGLIGGGIDAMDVYTTDASIRLYGIRVLEDDLQYFPAYNAVFIYRDQWRIKASNPLNFLSSLEGLIDEASMAAMNAAVKVDQLDETAVAARFVSDQLDVSVAVDNGSWVSRLLFNTYEHLKLVGISLGAALLVALPLGVIAARFQRVGQLILAVVGIIQTIPSLALFVFMIPLVGIGGPPAILALFLYSLLPIVRNTHAGLTSIPPGILESANGIGLPSMARLRLVELPMAGSMILAGIKTSAVINVGTATLGALIGAGGYGQPILSGIRLDDVGLILSGAVPAAILALLVQGLFELIERFVVPKGLRL